MIYFFDTSALQYKYLTCAYSRGIRKTISDSRNESFISSATILEIASTFGKYCRDKKLSRSNYRQYEKLFWKDIFENKLNLREARKREYTKALHLIEHAGVGLGRRITSFDALIAATCLELAMEKSARVKFILADASLYDVLRRISAYTSAIEFRFIGKPKPYP